jgi:GT2 family glycosyltransferase
MSDNTNPILSVVIPTMGRVILIQTLESLERANQFDQIEVVVAGRVHDVAVFKKLEEICVRAPNVKHLDIQFSRGDSSEKKNAGWRAARADLIAFLDDDVVVAPDWPDEIRRPFESADVGGVSGPSLVPPDVGRFAHLAGIAMQSKAAGYVSERYLKGSCHKPKIVGWSRMIGCNMAYRRSVLESIGGFDPAFWPGEEMLAAYRAGLQTKLVFAPQAWVYHYPRVSFLRFWKQMSGYGATRIRLIRAGVEFEPTTVVPALWVVSLLVLLVLAPFGGLFRFLLALHVGVYLLADAWITVDKLMETRRLGDALVFFLIPVIHLSYGLAQWREFFQPNRELSETTQPITEDRLAR